MELNFDDDSLKPFEVLKKIELFFPDSINVKKVFDRFDWVHNNSLCRETLRYLAQQNLISRVDETNYKIEDAGRAAIRAGSIEKYLEKINAEKSKMDDLKALQ